MRLLFALPSSEGVLLLRRVALPGPQSAAHIANFLSFAVRELTYFPWCAPLLPYCISLFAWPVQTPSVRSEMSRGARTWPVAEVLRAKLGREALDKGGFEGASKGAHLCKGLRGGFKGGLPLPTG